MSGDQSNATTHTPQSPDGEPAESQQNSEPEPRELPPLNRWFNICGGLAALFIITIFAFVASMLGDPDAPVTQFLDQHGGTLMGLEVAAIIIVGLLAMGNDGPDSKVPPVEFEEDSSDSST